MIRTRSNIIRYNKIYNSFIWYKHLNISNNLFYKINFSMFWKFNWYEKSWMINAYIMRKMDDVKYRIRRKYAKRKYAIVLSYKNYHNITKYCMVQNLFWRKMKYGILLNYIVICKIFLRYITKLIQFYKNDVLIFTNFFTSSTFSDKVQESNYTYEFKLSKKYWDYMFKLINFNFLWFQRHVLRDIFFYSHFASLVIFNSNFKLLNVYNIYNYNIIMENSFNIINTSIQIPKSKDLLDTYILNYTNFLLNEHVYIYNIFIILEIYKSTILILKNSI